MTRQPPSWAESAFTDNSKFKLVKHSRVPKDLGSKIAILVPRKRKMLTSSVNASSFERLPCGEFARI